MGLIPTILLSAELKEKEPEYSAKGPDSEREGTCCLLGSSHGDHLRKVNTELLGPYHTSSGSSGRLGGDGATALRRYQIPLHLLTKAKPKNVAPHEPLIKKASCWEQVTQANFRTVQCPLCCKCAHTETQFGFYKRNVISSWGMYTTLNQKLLDWLLSFQILGQKSDPESHYS